MVHFRFFRASEPAAVVRRQAAGDGQSRKPLLWVAVCQPQHAESLPPERRHSL
jgi:hypothetical protein